MAHLFCGRGPSGMDLEADKENQGCVARRAPGKGPASSVLMGKAALAYRKPLASNGENVSKAHCIPEYNSNVSWMDSHTVVLKKGRFGYGFSVTGSSPTRVSSVKSGSPADLAGVQKGDFIVKINGQNVSRSMADSVAKIIRFSEKQIVMDLYRSESAPSVLECSDTQSVSSWQSGHRSSSRQPACQSTPLDQSSVSSVQSRHPVSSSSCSQEPRLTSFRELSQSTLSLHAALPRLDRELQNLGCEDRQRQLVVERLHTLEAEFVHKMHTGLQAYLHPLYDCALSRTEHSTLFQNIDQIARYSERHLSSLQESFNTGHCPGAIYQSCAEDLANAYETYCNGLKNAFRLLIELSEDTDFKTLLKELSMDANSLSISQFLQKPLQHIKDLVLTFQDLAVSTPIEHYDYDNTKQVVEALRGACNRINDSNTRKYSSSSSLSSGHSRSSGHSSRSHEESHQSGSPEQCIKPFSAQDSAILDTSMSSEHSKSSHSSGSSHHSNSSIKTKSSDKTRSSQQTKSSSDQSMVSIASVDSEVLDIQTRLVLPDHMPAIQIATASRHMIYAGDLFYFDGLLWTKLYVVLLNDLLLITQADEEDRLTLWEEPIILDCITGVIPQGVHESEFSLQLLPGSLPSFGDMERSSLTLQAPTQDLKSTWTNLLSQRILAYRQQAAANVNFDNVV